MMQFNVGTVRNPISQEDELPQTSPERKGQGEPLMTEGAGTPVHVLSQGEESVHGT